MSDTEYTSIIFVDECDTIVKFSMSIANTNSDDEKDSQFYLNSKQQHKVISLLNEFRSKRKRKIEDDSTENLKIAKDCMYKTGNISCGKLAKKKQIYCSYHLLVASKKVARRKELKQSRSSDETIIDYNFINFA